MEVGHDLTYVTLYQKAEKNANNTGTPVFVIMCKVSVKLDDCGVLNKKKWGPIALGRNVLYTVKIQLQHFKF